MTTIIRVLIVDDEPLARGVLREMLQSDSDVAIVGECVNGKEAVQSIQELTPDLLFLDIQMPEMGGFEVLDALQGTRIPHLVFVTAYDQYAVRAFEVHALDYILKPFDRERFEASWQRAKAQVLREHNGGVEQRILSLLEDLKAGINISNAWLSNPPAAFTSLRPMISIGFKQRGTTSRFTQARRPTCCERLSPVSSHN